MSITQTQIFPWQTMRSAGWIKLWRTWIDNPYLRDAKTLAVWIWLLTHAAHGQGDAKPQVRFMGRRIALEPGQTTAGTRQIASDLNLDKSTVYRILRRFEDEAMIETHVSSRCSLITVLNWGQYQLGETQNETLARRDKDDSGNLYKKEKNEKNENHTLTGGSLREPTPGEIAKRFFDFDDDIYEMEKDHFVMQGIDRDFVEDEIFRFANYWGEYSKDGTQQRWETESNFELRKRLIRWFSNAVQKRKKSDSEMELPDRIT